MTGRQWRYDGIGPDGVGEWILNLWPKLGKEINHLRGVVTIQVYE